MLLVMVAFNRPEHVQLMLESIYMVQHGTGLHPVIVNNGSRKKTTDLINQWASNWAGLCKNKDQVRQPEVITLDKNIGFAGGLNAGLKLAKGHEEVCVVHSDVVLLPEWAGECVESLRNWDDDAGLVCPRTCYANEHSVCIPELRASFEKVKPPNKDHQTRDDLAAILDSLYGVTPEERKAFVDKFAEAVPRTSHLSDMASFCMVFKTTLLEKYGVFCEDFFPRGYEDKFWFHQAQCDGWVAGLSNRAFVHHWGNVTSDGPGFNFPEMFKRNEEKFNKKMHELNSRNH